jgi:hypothetical protein
MGFLVDGDRRYLPLENGYKEHNAVTGLQNDHEKLIGEKQNIGMRMAWRYWNLTERDVNCQVKSS